MLPVFVSRLSYATPRRSCWSDQTVHAICHRLVPRSLTQIFATIFLPPAILTLVDNVTPSPIVFVKELGVYVSVLALSVAAYRASPFHPLAKYPGPFLARISDWWSVWNGRHGKQHLMYRRLHQRYGDVVRTGPNFIHLRDASAIPVVLGPRWHKPAGYEVPLPPGGTPSLMTTTHPAIHKERRQRWDRAFTGAALQHYEPMFFARLAQLRDALDARCDRPIDLSDWIGFFTLDFMGDFALGGQFNFMAAGVDANGLRRTITGAMAVGDLGSRVAWIRPFVHLVPNPMDSLLTTALEVARERKSSNSSEKNLFYYLIGDDASDVLSDEALAQDALVAIVGGSDTSGTLLCNAVYYLISNPAVLSKLRAELDASLVADEGLDTARLAGCKYLQAVINETMRLAPAIPNGAPRKVPPGESAVVAGHVMPPDTTVYIAYYCLFRDARYFSDPDAFVPDRWLDAARPADWAHEPRAFIPFNYGPTVCAGKALAQRIVRATLVTLVQRYELAFAPGYDPKQWEEDLRDRYILARGELPVVLARRR